MKEAFVYCWTDTLTNKLYVGVHKGFEDDGYVCSSKLVMEQYNQRPQDFSRQIISHGSWEDMVVFETAILTAVDAAHDPMFFNKINSYPNFYNTDESQQRASISRVGKKHTEEWKKKISEGNKGKIISSRITG